MKVYLKNPPMSRAMDRVTTALTNTARGIRVVSDITQADLVALHVIGWKDLPELINEIVGHGQKYAIIQYCLRTTEKPSTLDWLPLWQGAEVVWSYYDLERLYLEDQTTISGDRFTLRQSGVNFYHSPLGVDSEKFRPWNVPKRYDIATSGYVMEAEGVLEANGAVTRMGGRQFHLGPTDDRLLNTDFKLDIHDGELAQHYSRSRYVAGLRRVEGFELPAAEGFLCGARPIVFDAPHYRQWYEDFAIFIPEGTPDEVSASIEQILKGPYPEVTPDEIEKAKARFNWESIGRGFWAALQKPLIRLVSSKRSLLWIGDAGVSTGFAQSTHKILETVCKEWDVHVLGLNYVGDPHNYPYPIYPPNSRIMGADPFGVMRVPELVLKVRPDMIVVQNDPWNFPGYLQIAGNVPVMGIVAVDGLNCRGKSFNGLRKAIFWTKFGEDQARMGGYSGASAVIPLGVDTKIFHPMDRLAARQKIGLPQRLWDKFIVGNVNRNQPRKRMDLMVSFFAQWIRKNKIDNAYLYLHVAPTGDAGYDVRQLAEYFGITKKVVTHIPEIGHGAPEEYVAATYCAFDVAASTTQGEGFGLTTLEAMACGIPFIGPDWAALGDWAKDAMWPVPIAEIACTPNNVNVLGGIPGRQEFIEGLHTLYTSPMERNILIDAGLQLVPRFNWKDIGERFLDELNTALEVNSSPPVFSDVATV